MPRRSSLLPILPLCATMVLGCAKADTLTVKPGTPSALEIVPSPRLEEFVYKKILLLPFEGEVTIKDTDVSVPATQTGSYYTGKLEKALLARGFEVISPEVVARAAKTNKGVDKLSAMEKAMVMGKETKADAVFVIQSISVEGVEVFYAVDELETVQVDRSKVKQNLKSGQFYQPETKDCVYRLPYYAVQMEGKLIDAHTGNVLWVGSGRQTAVDSLAESYVAKLGKECELLEENFVFTDKMADEAQLGATFVGLIERLLAPLETEAFAGKPLPADKPKAKKEPPPKVEEPKAPAAKTAVVSIKKASVRSQADKRSDRLRYVTRKTKLEVVETMGEWHKVKLQDGTVGWMHESTIIINE